MSPTPRITRMIAAAAAAAMLAAGGILAAVPATAHDTLLGSSPAAGTTLETPPAEVALSFSGDVLDQGSSVVVEVTTPDGRDVADGAPAISGTEVAQALLPGLPGGAYTVLWRVVSSDGHPISGSFGFAVAGPAAAPVATAPVETPSPTPTASPVAIADDAASASEGAALFPVLAVLVGVVIIGGALVAMLMVRRERHRRDRAATKD